MNPDTIWQRVVITTYGVVLASVLAWSAKISGDVTRHTEAIADIRAVQAFYSTTTIRTDKQLADIVSRLEKMQADLYAVKIEVVKQAPR